jgi:hypothetical protein
MERNLQKEMNNNALTNPKPGDYWSERFVGICIVLEITDDFIYICNKKLEIDDNHWTFDLTHITQLTKEQFIEYLSYSNNLELGTFCDVSRNQKYYSFVEDYLERKKNNRFTVIIKNDSIEEDIKAINRIQTFIKLLIDTIETEKPKLTNQTLIYHIDRLTYTINNCERDLINAIRFQSEPNIT